MWAPTFAEGRGSFFKFRKALSECLEKYGLNCNLSHQEGQMEAWSPPPERKLNWAQVAAVPSWPPTCVLTQPLTWNNCQERTKCCFFLGPWLLTWKEWCLSNRFGQGTCKQDRVRCKGGWLGVKVDGCGWIPNTLKKQHPQDETLCPSQKCSANAQCGM